MLKMSEKNEGRQIRMNWKFLDLAWLRALPLQKVHNMVDADEAIIFFVIV